VLALSDNTQPFPVQDALAELSEGAFCVWVAMLAIPPAELRKGRRNLARLTRYPRSTLDRRLRELRDKGYIRLVMHGFESGTPTEIILVKRAQLAGFVRV
jgi:hypothetical protein